MFISKEWQRASCTVGGEFWRISFLGKFPSLYLSANFQKCMNWERGERRKHTTRSLTVGGAASAPEWVALAPACRLWSEACTTDVLGAGEHGAHLWRWKSGETRWPWWLGEGGGAETCRGLVTPLLLLGVFPSEIFLTICKAGRYRKHC